MKLEESLNIEFKAEMIPDIEEWIIAFLNSEGGTIYIGIDDNRNVVGVSEENRDHYDLHIGNLVSDAIRPNCRDYVSFGYDDDNVLVIKIKPGSNKPYYLKRKGPKSEGVFVRVGRSRRNATDDEILRMIKDSSGYSWEKEISEEQELTFNKMKIIADAKGVEFHKGKYKNLGIVDKSGMFTNLGLLVSDQSPIEVKFAVYDKHIDFKVKKEFTGSIVDIAYNLLDYAELFNDTSAKIIPGRIDRVEKKSFPGASLRESVLNAICHADYSMRSNIKVEFFPSFAKITNPGGIYNSTMEEILTGTQSFRNPGLVIILNKFHFIENYGTGMLRIQEAYEDLELKPDFHSSEYHFIVKLPNMNYAEVTDDVTDVTKNVTEVDQLDSVGIVLKLIKDGINTTKGLIEKTGKTKMTISRITKKLVEENKIYRVGSNRDGHWEIIDKE